MGFAAVNTGNNLLYLVVSALLGFMSITGIVGWRNIRGLCLTVDLPDEIYSGAATLVTLRIRNLKRHVPSFLLSPRLLGHSRTMTVLKSGDEETASLIHTFSGRGEKSFPGVEVRSPFPVNFFVRYVKLMQDRTFIVFPAPHRCRIVSTVDPVTATGYLPAPTKGGDFELARIADYTGSEPMKLIHWRLSAKHDELKVRELSSTCAEPLVIDIDNFDCSDVEEKLSRACYLINRLIGANRAVGLKLGKKVIPPGASREHRLGLLRELATHGQD